MAREQRNESFKVWGLRDNPFASLPPANEEERQHVFTGRQAEVEKLINLVERPRGIFLVGLFGVGKSILALETLRLLNQKGSITAYAKYDREFGFTKSALKKLATACAKHDHEAVYRTLMRGGDGGRRERIDQKDIVEAVYNIKSGMAAIEDIAQIFRKPEVRTTFVIVVDDLDKGTDIGNINQIIQDTRQLVELGCAVILPGHPFGSTAGFSSSADVLNPVTIEPLSEPELVEMMGKYLDLARQFSSTELELSPFTLDAAHLIANGIAEFGLTPRIFNFACQLLLEEAADEGVSSVTHQFVAERWGKIAKDFLMRSLHDNDKRHLKIIYENGGLLSEDAREPIKQIGGEFAEYSQVRTILTKLIQENILIESVEEGKRKMSPNPLITGNDNIFIIR